MSVDTDQLIIDHFGEQSTISDLVGSRIWIDNTIPAAVKYNPGQGAAILITRRGGLRPYTDGLRDPSISTRVYGPSREAIRAVTDELDLLHASQTGRSSAILTTEWQDDSEPGTGWKFSFALWIMRLRIA